MPLRLLEDETPPPVARVVRRVDEGVREKDEPTELNRPRKNDSSSDVK